MHTRTIPDRVTPYRDREVRAYDYACPCGGTVTVSECWIYATTYDPGYDLPQAIQPCAKCGNDDPLAGVETEPEPETDA